MPESAQHDLGAVFETSRLLTSLDLDAVLGQLLLVAMGKAMAMRGVVLVADHEAGGDPLAFHVGAVKGALPWADGDRLPLTDTIERPVQGDGVPEPLRAAGVALALPIPFGGRTLAVLGLGPRAMGGPHPDATVQFLRSLAGMAAPAVHNARVADALKRSAEELEGANRDLGARVQELNALFELAQAFGRTLDATRAVRLLSLTLLGQVQPQRHAVLLAGDDDGGALALAECHGLTATLGPDVIAQIAALDRPLALTDDRADPLDAALYEAGLTLVVPLQMQGATRAAILLGPRRERPGRTGGPYTDTDAAFVASLGHLALSAVENARLVEARLEKERLEEELRLARTIQERLLPAAMPEVAGADLAAMALPSRFVAGDYYEAIRLDSGQLLLAVADVSGKGMAAALLMANLQAGLHVLRGSGLDLPEATARLNRLVCENTDAAKFITFCWALYDADGPDAGRLRYVNAGHNPPMLVRADGRVEELTEGGLILGVLPTVSYQQGETRVAPGDLLVLFSDGVTEAPDADGEEYGEACLANLLRKHRDGTAAQAVAAIRADVARFTDAAPLSDDRTVLALKRTA